MQFKYYTMYITIMWGKEKHFASIIVWSVCIASIKETISSYTLLYFFCCSLESFFFSFSNKTCTHVWVYLYWSVSRGYRVFASYCLSSSCAAPSNHHFHWNRFADFHHFFSYAFYFASSFFFSDFISILCAWLFMNKWEALHVHYTTWNSLYDHMHYRDFVFYALFMFYYVYANGI